jgi:hypothetical protein
VLSEITTPPSRRHVAASKNSLAGLHAAFRAALEPWTGPCIVALMGVLSDGTNADR